MTDFAVELSGVRKRYRYFSLDNIDLKLPRGQIMGLIGANGAGKSSVARPYVLLSIQEA
jgi:ABC-2 type transport system ATP-binding protein